MSRSWKICYGRRSIRAENSSLPGYSKEDYGRFRSSQEWKSGAAAHDRSGKPEETSWDAMQQIGPHHGEPLLDGNAQSVRYGKTIHDGSGQPESVLTTKKRQNRKLLSWVVTQQILRIK